MCCLIQNLSHAFLILDSNTLYKMLIIKQNANIYVVPSLVKLFDGRLDLWLLVGAIAERSMCGLFAVAEPVVAGFLYFESNRPASKCR